MEGLKTMSERQEQEYFDRLKSRHKKFDGFGESHTAAEWSRLLGLPRNTLWRYLKGGLSIEEAAKLRGVSYP